MTRRSAERDAVLGPVLKTHPSLSSQQVSLCLSRECARTHAALPDPGTCLPASCDALFV